VFVCTWDTLELHIHRKAINSRHIREKRSLISVCFQFFEREIMQLDCIFLCFQNGCVPQLDLNPFFFFFFSMKGAKNLSFLLYLETLFYCGLILDDCLIHLIEESALAEPYISFNSFCMIHIFCFMPWDHVGYHERQKFHDTCLVGLK
jgi:hypothetical protein